MVCTWVDCKEKGDVPQLDNNGNEWGNLCQEHHDEIENAIASEPFSAKTMLSCWIKAQGGAKKAASRMC